VAALVMGASACGGGADDQLSVEDAWARATPAVATVGAIYLRITSPVDDELVGATVDPSVAESVQLHSTEVDDAGTATMTEQMSLAIPAGGELELDPLGNHLMLVGLTDPLARGERFDVTLQLTAAGEVTAEVEVRDSAP
jgi:copper(I)-binding protein